MDELRGVPPHDPLISDEGHTIIACRVLSDPGLFNKAWDSSTLIIDRVTSGELVIENPVLTVLLQFQPGVFHELTEGALQLICGSANGILDHVINQDIVTFTGSASTGMMLKKHPRLLEESVPFNMEADSLNCCVLGLDAAPGTPDFDIFIKEIHREIVTKAGQKCTAVRRVMVPENFVEDVQLALSKRLQSTTIGDPQLDGVRMGALAGKAQLKEVTEKIAKLAVSQQIIYDGRDAMQLTGGDKNKGTFIAPVIFLNANPFTNIDCHNIEAFGPISTIMPYKTIDDAIQLARMGKGSLVSSIITSDAKIALAYTIGAACMVEEFLPRANWNGSSGDRGAAGREVVGLHPKPLKVALTAQFNFFHAIDCSGLLRSLSFGQCSCDLALSCRCTAAKAIVLARLGQQCLRHLICPDLSQTSGKAALDSGNRRDQTSVR